MGGRLMQRVLYKDPQGKMFVVYDNGAGEPVQNSYDDERLYSEVFDAKVSSRTQTLQMPA